MQHRLTETERMLLSAYIDGELSAAEQREVGELLASSPDARAYADDLRALNGVSNDAFPVIGAVGATLGAASTAKLSGSAIKIAAERGAPAKGLLTSGWGMTGLATAAVAAAASIIMLTKGPATSTSPATPTSHQTVVAATPSDHAMLPTVTPVLDTSSLIVPAMTPSEMLGFAVNGTLPIDSQRDRLVCLGPDTASHALTGVSVAEIKAKLDNLKLHSLKLDSLQCVVRTALINYSDDRIAVRADIPALRLQVLDRIEENMALQLPQNVRAQLVIARRTIADARSSNAREPQWQVFDDDEPSAQAGVRYVVASARPLREPTPTRAMRIPLASFISDDGSAQVVLIGNGSINGLRRKIQVMVATDPNPSGETRLVSRQRSNTASASAGVSVSRSESGAQSAATSTQDRVPRNSVNDDHVDVDRLLNGLGPSLKQHEEAIQKLKEDIKKRSTAPLQMPPK